MQSKISKSSPSTSQSTPKVVDNPLQTRSFGIQTYPDQSLIKPQKQGGNSESQNLKNNSHNAANIPAFAPDKTPPAPPKPLASFLQPKLQVSKPGDKYEQEANQVPSQVVQRQQENQAEIQTKLDTTNLQRQVSQQMQSDNTTIQKEPAVQNAVDPGKITQAVEDLYEAMDGLGTDEDTIMATLRTKTPEEIAAIEKEYLKTHGKTLEYDLRDELSGKDLTQALGYLSKAKVTQVSGEKDTDLQKELAHSPEMLKAADALHKAIDGWGTDEDTIMGTLRGKSKEEIEAIKRIYLDHYGKSLESDLKDELSGDDLKEAMAYLGADLAYSAAKGLENSLSWINDDEAKIEEILMSLPAEEIDRLQANHAKIISKMLGSLGGFDKKVVEELLAKNKSKAIAYRLYEAMKGAGTDEDAVKKYLNGKSELELIFIKKEYENITHRTLDADIDDEFSDNWLTGSEKTEAKTLLDADPYKQAAARIYKAAYGAGTDEAAIYNEFKGKSPEECKKIIDAYNDPKANFGGDGAFQKMIREEFSDTGWGKELTKIKQYSGAGKLDPVFALEDAMNGLGTSEEQIKEVLADKSQSEIAEIKNRYKDETGTDLETTLASELSGRDWHEVQILLKGKPETIKEKWLVIKARYDFEIGGGSSSFSRWVMGASQDLGFTTSKLQLEKQYWRLTQIVDENGNLQSGYTEKDFNQVYNYTETDVKNYEAAKNAVTEAIVSGVNLTTAIIATCLSAGAASPWLVAAIVTGVGGGVGMAIKKGMQGDAYGGEQIAIDTVMTAVSAALAGLGEAKAIGDKLDEMAAVFGTKFAQSAFKEVFTETVKSGASDLISSLIENAMNNDRFRDSLLDGLAEMGAAGGKAGALAAIKEAGKGTGKLAGKEAWAFIKAKLKI